MPRTWPSIRRNLVRIAVGDSTACYISTNLGPPRRKPLHTLGGYLTYPLGVSYYAPSGEATTSTRLNAQGEESIMAENEVMEVQDVTDQTFDSDVIKSDQ